MSVLSNLEPKAVFTFFEELCAIPHGSGHTKAISDYLAAFGRARGLETHQDAANNVIIKAPGTPGYEQSAPVIVQGHMDMVCAKAPDCAKDMEREGLELAVEGDTVLARGTSLGGDDGIAVAMALALLDAKDLPHPPIEAVFTVDEEIGLLGAAALDVSHLRGRRLINIDSEEEGVFTVGCAGRRNGALRAARHAHGLRRSRHDRHGQRPARRALRLGDPQGPRQREHPARADSQPRGRHPSRQCRRRPCSTTPSCAR